MQIRDLESKACLDRATIRFYEKEGFIVPCRKENGYREYSQQDLDDLLKIKLLRKIGISLETIRKLKQGTEDFSNILSNQIHILEHEISTKKRAIEVCRLLRENSINYSSLNAEYYLNKFNTFEEEPKAAFSFHELVTREYHPVRRYLARMADYSILSVILYFILVILLRLRPFYNIYMTAISLIVPFIAVPAMAFSLHRFGTTPGKWLFGLHVLSENGCYLTYKDAKEREWDVLQLGYGYGIPYWSIYRLYKSYKAYTENEAEWDYKSEYHYKKWSLRRKAALACSIASIILLNILIVNDQLLPINRGDLTINQFASNYNFYYKTLIEDYDISGLLQENGTWTSNEQGIGSIYFDGEPEFPNQQFEFTCADDRVTGIRYSNTWNEIRYLQPISVKCMVAATTAVLSQRGMSGLDFIRFAQEWDHADKSQDGSLKYNNVLITWKIDTENCSLVHDNTYVADEGTKQSSISLVYEIRISPNEHNNPLPDV